MLRGPVQVLECRLRSLACSMVSLQKEVQILKASYKKVASESPEGLQGMKLSLQASFKSEALWASDLNDAQGESLSP